MAYLPTEAILDGDAPMVDVDPARPDFCDAMLRRMLLHEEWDAVPVLARLRGTPPLGLIGMLALMTTAARALGTFWTEDVWSFSDVTLGMHRLTLLLYEIEGAADFPRERLHGGSILLAPVADDQHSFGLAVVATALRQRGWDVATDLSGDPDRIVAQARARRFDCIGLSVGHDRAVATARDLIARLRRPLRTTAPTIAVGGPMLGREPRLDALVGADCVASDGFTLADVLAQKYAVAS